MAEPNQLNGITFSINPLQKSMNEIQFLPIDCLELKCNRSCRDSQKIDDIENQKREIKRQFLDVNNSMIGDERTHASSIVNYMSVDDRESRYMPKSQLSTIAWF